MSDLATLTVGSPGSSPRDQITIGKAEVVTASGKAAEVFTMTLGGETINLLPLRNWSQLDVYKWRARGKLPGTPAGLEITSDHVKVTGETVSINEPGGTLKLQKLLNEWLALESGVFDLAGHKAHAASTWLQPTQPVQPEDGAPHFHVELDREDQVHVHCLHGKRVVATIGLNLPGFVSLFNEGLMHKPHSLKVGALHDWVELDGELFSFERGNNDASKLEQALNDRYLCTAAPGQGKDVVVFTNSASSTGFDIQFPAKEGGVIQTRRRPLNEEALDLLMAAEKCSVLPKDLVIKLSRPYLIFRRKTADGGERSLDEGPETIVTVAGDEGEVTMVDLSKPVNYLRLSAVVLTAVLNHPAINQHGRAAPPPSAPVGVLRPTQVAAPPVVRPVPTSVVAAPPKADAGPMAIPKPPPASGPLTEAAPAPPPKPGESKPAPRPAETIRPLPNQWLQAVLHNIAARHDWFPCLVYRQMAEHFGNSCEGFFGPFPCWACSLGGVEDISAPGFRGIFLTQKGGLGYLNHGHIARFRNGVAFIGTLESVIEAIDVNLLAAGVDSQQRIVFIVTEGYRARFGIPEQTVIHELTRLREHAAVVMSPSEALQSPEPIEVIWTVPAQQENPDDPQAVETLRPSASAADAG